MTWHMRQRNNLVATPGMPVRSTDSRRLDVDHNAGTWTFGTRHIGNAEWGTDDVEDNRTHSLVLQRAESTGFSYQVLISLPVECIRDYTADLNGITVEGSTSRQTIGPIHYRASRQSTWYDGPDGNIVPEEFG